ncbi:MAG: 6,7-dimethyl-8-ribityllumazine synthase [Candidatus Omnitrophica bacterium]|nr:6,7-dimethyl-8-ribityllumazine synthase [Candidatus Omnitrophota bacterium]
MKGIRRLRGSFDGRGRTFALAVSDFNEALTRQLLDGAVDTLLRHRVRPADITVAHVPGAFELPLAVRRLIRRARPDAVIALAVVIRGQTRHFDQVVQESARGLREIALAEDVPVLLGIVPAENAAQAIERCGIKQMNKGREWALAALEASDVLRRIQGSPRLSR